MPIDRRSFLPGALMASAFSAAGPMSIVAAKAPMAARQVPGLYRLKVGGFEVTAVNDGMLGLDIASIRRPRGRKPNGSRKRPSLRRGGFPRP